MDYPDKSNEITRVFARGRQEAQSLRETGRCHAAGFEDGKRDHEVKNAGAF